MFLRSNQHCTSQGVAQLTAMHHAYHAFCWYVTRESLSCSWQSPSGSDDMPEHDLMLM